MSCPFLTRLSQSYVKNYAPILLKMYGSQCPVISRNLNNIAKNEIQGETLYNDIFFLCLPPLPF